MKFYLFLVLAITSHALTLQEAEELTASNKAVMLEVNKSELNRLRQLKTSRDEQSKKRQASPKDIVSAVLAQSLTSGVDISNPMTLSVFLKKMSDITGKKYYCEEEINIPPTPIVIKSLDHLSRYMSQVTKYDLIIKHSPTDDIPSVIYVMRRGGKQ